MKTPNQTQSQTTAKAERRTLTGLLAGIAAAALLSAIPARAEGVAAVTLGLPHAQVTVAKTWDDGDHRQIVTQETVVPAPAIDCDDAEADQPAVVESEMMPAPAPVIVVEHPAYRVVHGRRVWVERRPEYRVFSARPNYARAPYRGRVEVSSVHGRAPGHAVAVNHAGKSPAANAGGRNLYSAPSSRPSIQRGVQR